VRKAVPILLLAAVCAKAQAVAEAPARLLWQIGQAGGNPAEFAATLDKGRRFLRDAFFVIGRSDAARDWPRIHPGPRDEWAGGRQHSFTVLFAVKDNPLRGSCRLRFKLAGAHPQSPPWLVMAVNGEEFFKKKIGREQGENSRPAAPGGIKEIEFDIPFAAALLKSGANEITLTTVDGGWMLYNSISLEAPATVEPSKVADTVVTSITSYPGLIERNGKAMQAIQVSFFHFGKSVQALISLDGKPVKHFELRSGRQVGEVLVPAVEHKGQVAVTVETDGKPLATQTITLEPVRKVTVYILPHSHTDIGFTEIQTAIASKQVTNLIDGIRYARKTASYPAGARFVWNVEVLWAADLYLNRLSASQHAEFFDAVKRGQVALNGMYLNELTGLCRPEELMHLFRYSTKLSAQCGVSINSAMISDVPGYTWGTVSAMAQAGIKYFSVAPNWFDRIGDIQARWQNKAFYWLSPSGKEKVLVWLPYNGYGLANRTLRLTPPFVRRYLAWLETNRYPYDITYLRWCGHGDNGVPDPAICEFVKNWNGKYAWPKFIISSTSEAFRAFEERHGPSLPVMKGDWTPYWEDGAGSSARETALNRASSDALVQAQALWAMLNPSSFPADAFERAWKNILLYSEHTWGASSSITDPESAKTKEQWAIKQGYALDGYKQSTGALLPRALALAGSSTPRAAFDVWNTTSWERSELVALETSEGDRVLDDRGELLPSQRTGGSLMVMAKDVPPFAARRLTVSKGDPSQPESVTASNAILDNGIVRVRADEKTGGIVELSAKGIDGNFADTTPGEALNDFLYLVGSDATKLQRNGPVRISVGDKGPLVASLLIESDAPGCRKLTRELRLAAGCDYVEVINTVDKRRIEAANYRAPTAKESVNFAFPFHVPSGEMLIDIPLGAFRPETDQIPSACKNWLTVGRWADVSNPEFGVTWVTLDAPLIELGGITATMLNSQRNPAVWRHKIEPTQKLYSWVMNNHWGTNYRAYQEGPVRFRYVLRPHRRFSPAEAARLAAGFGQPLLVRPATTTPVPAESRLSLSSPEVLVTGLKPSDDGRALVVRLFGASGKDETTRITWSDPKPKELWLSDTSERPLRRVEGTIHVPAWGVVTLRAW
jgi:alpha-mannosidase